jgi:hypothetical protein
MEDDEQGMMEDPPQARLEKLTGVFAKVGVGRGQDIDKLDDATKCALRVRLPMAASCSMTS